ncbi:hypothetical protein N9118_10140 [Akkermansiaceae bacterium]|jgi:hypothetical protein|nr:hypothetical protein [Akkermansiaceae bacterium]|tara:strand:+ start:147 stop:299 length:153 start_codon:yes stop_codon:yes gene_type:complete
MSAKTIKRYDHYFPCLPEGKLVSHDIYDIQANISYVTIGRALKRALLPAL